MDDSDEESLYEQALAVDDNGAEKMDLTQPPTTGNEYLLRVRQEANHCPKVVVADIDTSAFLQQQTVKVSEPGGLLPVPATYKAPMAWQRLQVAEFAAVRQKLIQFKALMKQKKIKVPVPKLPAANDAENWCRLCFGRLKLKKVEDNDASESVSDTSESTAATTETTTTTTAATATATTATTAAGVAEDGTPPLLHIISQMNQNQVTNVLEYHINWLEATGFSKKQGCWFYSLLANLQKPLTPEVCAWLRRLARVCSNIRASLDSCEDPKLNELNLIICLVSRYFDQRDLAD